MFVFSFVALFAYTVIVIVYVACRFILWFNYLTTN